MQACVSTRVGLLHLYADAEPLFRRALAILEKALGPEHRDVTSAPAVASTLAPGRLKKGLRSGRFESADLGPAARGAASSDGPTGGLRLFQSLRRFLPKPDRVLLSTCRPMVCPDQERLGNS
jgi:hypothetical protein